jgi:hypothetical protein
LKPLAPSGRARFTRRIATPKRRARCHQQPCRHSRSHCSSLVIPRAVGLGIPNSPPSSARRSGRCAAASRPRCVTTPAFATGCAPRPHPPRSIHPLFTLFGEFQAPDINMDLSSVTTTDSSARAAKSAPIMSIYYNPIDNLVLIYTVFIVLVTIIGYNRS